MMQRVKCVLILSKAISNLRLFGLFVAFAVGAATIASPWDVNLQVLQPVCSWLGIGITC
jgi:hypothetical protein